MSEMADEQAVVENEAAVEEPVAETTTEAAPVAEAPALDPREVQAELEYLRQQNDQLSGFLQQLTTQPGQNAQQAAAAQGVDISSIVDEYGNLDPQRFAQYQTQRDQALLSQIGQMFQPIQQTFAQQAESAQIAEGEQRLADILADDVARNGEFASDPAADAQARDLVATVASQLFPEVSQRYGETPQAAEIAMTRAAEQVRGLLRTVGGAAVSQTQNQLATLATAQGEPGAHGAGVEAPVIRMGETSTARFAANS